MALTGQGGERRDMFGAMAKIFDLLLSQGRGLTGGHRMIPRHVEALRDLGFDNACLLGAGSLPPKGIEHSAPLLPASPVRPEDIIVLLDDAQQAIRFNRDRPERSVIFSQGGTPAPCPQAVGEPRRQNARR